MVDPLSVIRNQIGGTADAIRWACILEATAPKAGNVHPSQSFGDLSYADFITAANVTAQALTRTDLSIAKRMFAAVQQSRQATGTNVNLGIVLLLGPLVAVPTFNGKAVAEQLCSFTTADTQDIFNAIAFAGAGGLGVSESMDVTKPPTEDIHILAAMHLATDRDRIAKQYAGNYADLIENIVPVLAESIRTVGDVLAGIADAHLRMLASDPDSLIARKCGGDIAGEVQRQAGEVDRSDPESIARFDRFLRSRGNTLNPGTTADLIAAALYILLKHPDDIAGT
tara:strand:+ start:75701 stop:76549 length:849 start_codon:yes stop_codon:yes gene_type:complete